MSEKNQLTLRLPDWLKADFLCAVDEIGEVSGLHVTNVQAMAALIAQFLAINSTEERIAFYQAGHNWIMERAKELARAQSATDGEAEATAADAVARRRTGKRTQRPA